MAKTAVLAEDEHNTLEEIDAAAEAASKRIATAAGTLAVAAVAALAVRWQ